MIGATPEGYSVYFDAAALELDGIILLNRIKPHTDFHARIESGLIKADGHRSGQPRRRPVCAHLRARGLMEIIP
jgi:hypothetical protein